MSKTMKEVDAVTYIQQQRRSQQPAAIQTGVSVGVHVDNEGVEPDALLQESNALVQNDTTQEIYLDMQAKAAVCRIEKTYCANLSPENLDYDIQSQVLSDLALIFRGLRGQVLNCEDRSYDMWTYEIVEIELGLDDSSAIHALVSDHAWQATILQNQSCRNELARLAITIYSVKTYAISETPLAWEGDSPVVEELSKYVNGVIQEFIQPFEDESISSLCMISDLLKELSGQTHLLKKYCDDAHHPSKKGRGDIITSDRLRNLVHQFTSRLFNMRFEILPELLLNAVILRSETEVSETLLNNFICKSLMLVPRELWNTISEIDELQDVVLTISEKVMALCQLITRENLWSDNEEVPLQKLLENYVNTLRHTNVKAKKNQQAGIPVKHIQIAKVLHGELLEQKAMRVGTEMAMRDESKQAHHVRIYMMLTHLISAINPDLTLIKYFTLEYLERKQCGYKGLCSESDAMRERIVAVVTKDLEATALLDATASSEAISETDEGSACADKSEESLEGSAELSGLESHALWLQLANSPEVSPEGFAFLYAACKVAPRHQAKIEDALFHKGFEDVSMILDRFSPEVLADVILSCRISSAVAETNIKIDRKAVEKKCKEREEIPIANSLEAIWNM